MSGKKISVIPAKTKQEKGEISRSQALKVAAYCRVSTLLEHQETSYEAQVSYYTELISNHPEWKMAGIYADDGITATNTKHRENFNAMIADCMKGKIDLVLTKSISRFARNTVDSLQYIRMLKEKNIAIFFEKENINTMESAGELLITILSSQAQEESRNISENMRWSIRRKYENGGVSGKRLMGYCPDEKGHMVIVPEEAEVVRFIFKQYLEGDSVCAIARKLEEKGILTMRGNKKWNTGVIEKMLANEKYMGDALLQKTYTTDFLNKKRVVNMGELPQYYIENNHEAIIPKEIFYQVREERLRRASLRKMAATKKKGETRSKHSGKYALTELLVCQECGRPYRRQVWSKYGEKKVVWRCENRLRNGPKYCKYSPTLKEEDLHEAIIMAMNNVLENKDQFIRAFRENVIAVMGNSISDDTDLAKYDIEIEKLKEKMLKLIQENVSRQKDMNIYEAEYKEIAEHIEKLQMKKIAEYHAKAKCQSQNNNGIDKYISMAACTIKEYDDTMVRKLIQRISVVNENKIEILFKSGIVLEQTIDMCNSY